MNPVLSEECSPRSMRVKYPLLPSRAGRSGRGQPRRAAMWCTLALGTDGTAAGDAWVPGCPKLDFFSPVCYFMVAAGLGRVPTAPWCPAVKHPVHPSLRSAGTERASDHFTMVTPLCGSASVTHHKSEVVSEGFLPRGGTAMH